MNELALFAGAGGGILGGRLLGWRTVCAVEIDRYCREVLMQRQNDGMLEPFPIWDDVRTFDGRPWSRCVDIVTGGFPCQDISCAGKGAGIDGARSGLWSEMARIIGEIRPRYALVENSPMLIRRGLTRVLGDFAKMGYDARWGIIGGRDAKIAQPRRRIWISAVAVENSSLKILRFQSEHAKCNKKGMDGRAKQKHVNNGYKKKSTVPILEYPYWTEVFNGGGDRGINGLADRVVRERAIGNGQIPAVVALAWHILNTHNGNAT